MKFACLLFAQNFTNSIKQLLYIFPKNYVDKDGHPFWSGPKRAPDPVELNINDPLHLHFISAFANHVAFNTRVPQNRDKDAIAKIASKVELSVFAPRAGVKIQVEEEKKEETKKEEDTAAEEVERNNNLVKELDQTNMKFTKDDFDPADFEKDDDSNFHIDFIHATANLRARNYRITECDQLKQN